MAHPFELSNEIEVDATPEEVWEAIATGRGGFLRLVRGVQTVTTWQPPNRFAFRIAESRDGSLISFDYVVTARWSSDTTSTPTSSPGRPIGHGRPG